MNRMGPLIDTELERIDRKHATLSKLSSDLIETINLYHCLMRESEMGMQYSSLQNFPSSSFRTPEMMNNSLGMLPNMHMAGKDNPNLDGAYANNYHLNMKPMESPFQQQQRQIISVQPIPSVHNPNVISPTLAPQDMAMAQQGSLQHQSIPSKLRAI